MAARFLIGKAELLTFDILPPPIKPDKAHPYSLGEAKAHLVPQMVAAALEMQAMPQEACPSDIAVAKLDLHPAYIAKSFFPTGLLRQAGLASIGSRTVRVRPRRELRKTAGPESESTQLFVAGRRDAFARLPSLATQLAEGTREAIQFAEIEDFSSMTAADRVRRVEDYGGRAYEVGLHLFPDQGVDALRKAFMAYAKRCEFDVNTEFDFPVGRMLFLAVFGPADQVDHLAQFSLVRVIRPMPTIRAARPLMRGSPISVGFRLPSAAPLSDEPKVAILDGGLPGAHVLAPYVGRYERSDTAAGDVADYLNHGLGVTSAFLFGPIEPSGEALRPYSFVDHFRVLDDQAEHEDELELYRTLAHIEEVLLSRQYQFINLSLGPNLATDDDDVHSWTALLDTMLSDGNTLMTVAAGNNGKANAALGLNRIQVPADSVNALSVGAASHSGATWDRADYSAIGPGRSPGRRKPDLVAFGGCPKEYFHVPVPGRATELAAMMGTSFAAPYALRTAVGVRAVLGDAVDPLTIRALLVHAAQLDPGESVDETGWGRVPNDLNKVIMCEDGTARIIYQGSLRAGKYLRAPVPLPLGPLTGKVRLSATFCYASPVDVEDAAAYTKAGLTITFRPNATKAAGKQVKTRSFFSTREFRTEQEQRQDLGKWETVLHASDRMLGSSLNHAVFDIHYNARDGGGLAPSGAEVIRYALVVTVEAPKHASLYDDILAANKVLKAIEPRVTLPLRST